MPSMHDTFEWWIPIAKSTATDDGGFDVEGVASDERRDLQDEIIRASGIEKSLDYLRQFGVLNLDHGRQVIGRITDAWIANPDEVKQRWGWDVIGKATCVKSHVFPLADDAPEDLKTAHYYRQTQIPLGFSIQGAVESRHVMKSETGEEITVTVPKLVTKVALTAQPVNPGARAVAKSMAEFICGHVGERDAAAPTTHQTPTGVLILEKALTAGSGTDAASFTGGRALQPESLLGADKARVSCPRCGHLFDMPKIITTTYGAKKSIETMLQYLSMKRGQSQRRD